MESDKEEQDPFASIVELCQPTVSQEAKFRKCPFARDSENFSDLMPEIKKARVSVPVEEPEVVVIKTNEGLDKIEVIDLDSEDSTEKMASTKLVDDKSVHLCRIDVEEKQMNSELAKNSVGRCEKGVQVTTDEDTSRDGNGDEKIDKFRHVAGVDGSGEKRKLPVSITGKEKSVEAGGDLLGTEEKKRGLVDFLNVLKIAFGNMDDGCGDEDEEDILEIAKKRGLTFPRPRWWPPEGDKK